MRLEDKRDNSSGLENVTLAGLSGETRQARLTTTIGRRLRGDFSNVDPNVMKIATICMVGFYGAIGVVGIFVGLGMVDNAIRDIPAKYIDIVTNAALGGLLTGSASLGALFLISHTTPYWPRKKSG